MPEFYVIPAYLFNAPTITAVGERDAAKKFAKDNGVVGGRLAVVPGDAVKFKDISATTSVDASDAA